MVTIRRPPISTGCRLPGSPDPLHGSLFDQFNPAALPGANPGPQIERLVWFTTTVPNVAPVDLNISYYNKLGAAPLVNPGQYAVVGPRPTTYVGLNTGGTGATQQITLNPSTNTVSYTPANATGPNPAPTSVNAVPLICSSVSPATGWNPGMFPNNIGVSISEPMFLGLYYPPPTGPGPIGLTDTYSTPLDHPLDGPLGGVNAPLSQDAGLLSTGLKLNYKTALLQRLANPLMAYDQVSNPYITVDWQSIDLNVFNGEARQGSNPTPFELEDPAFSPPAGPPPNVVMGSGERGSPLPVSNSDFVEHHCANRRPFRPPAGLASTSLTTTSTNRWAT